MNQHRAGLYLQIPAAYCRGLGGLRWAHRGEAVEFLDGPGAGRTFAFAGEIVQFLQGLLVPGGPCPAFGAVLHLLYLIGLGDRAGGPADRRIARAADPFRELGNPLRNAGALCAWIHRDLPGVAEPPALSDLLSLLGGGGWIPQIVLSHPSLGAMDYAEQPPLEPDDFEAKVRARFDELPHETIRHWLKFGRGPAQAVEDAASLIPPRGLGGSLADLDERPRLSGLARLVEHLEGALALPPRRPDPTGLPAGGYWDLTNRGEPEQALPFQFALEPEEFLRRFAERELLYYHRETPARPVTRELVLLLDQGVRTWGDVRLVLAGATMAMARQGRRRGLAVRLATTGGQGEPVDPESLGAEALAALLEGSDLSPGPAATLARVLMGGDGHRPIDPARATSCCSRTRAASPSPSWSRRRAGSAPVQVEHPTPTPASSPSRSTRAARSSSPSCDGGGPVSLHRCRIDLSDPTPAATPAPLPAPRRRTAIWKGPVEPIPFPFRNGLLGPPVDSAERGVRTIDFDEGGERVLVLVRHGLIACYRVDGKSSEYLPRPIVDHEVVRPIMSVIGVQGGFVLVCGRPESPVLAHYDFTDRRCTVHRTDMPAGGEGPVSWYYHADLHTIVGQLAREQSPCYPFDLSEASERSSQTARALRAVERAKAGTLPYPTPAAQLQTHPSEPWPDVTDPSIRLDPHTGELHYTRGDGKQRVVTPMIDGVPALQTRGSQLVLTHQGGDTLAVQAAGCPVAGVWFVSMTLSEVIGSLPAGRFRPSPTGFALSRDGLRYARTTGESCLEVRDVPGGRPSIRTVSREIRRMHLASLGRSCLLIREMAEVGPRQPQSQVLVRWDRERLELERNEPEKVFAGLGGVFAEGRSLPAGKLPPSYDTGRFRQIIASSHLRILIDAYNHLAVQDRFEHLRVVFYMSGRDFAAWMPDGTRLGTGRLIGGGESRAAAERIARVLRSAEIGQGGQP